MNKKIGLLVVGIATLVIGTVFAFAHNRDGDHRGRGFRPDGFPPAFMIEKIASELGLSEEQKTQAKQILEDSKSRVEPLMKSIKENRTQIKDLGTDGNFDEGKVTEMASNQAATMKQLFIEKEKTKAQLFAILTPEQRVKAKEMQGKFGERMKGRFGRGHKNAGEKTTPNED